MCCGMCLNHLFLKTNKTQAIQRKRSPPHLRNFVRGSDGERDGGGSADVGREGVVTPDLAPRLALRRHHRGKEQLGQGGCGEGRQR